MTTIHLALAPRDGFFIKDGRGWNTSPTNRARSQDWPHPTTLRGALRGAWGRAREDALGTTFAKSDWEIRTRDVRLGGTFPLRRKLGETWKAAHRMWPVPADAIQLPDKEGKIAVTRLCPKRAEVATLGRTEEGEREHLWFPVVDSPDKPVPMPRWWAEADLVAWLTGKTVAPKNRDDVAAAKLMDRTQVHVSINADTLASVEGALFSTQVMDTLGKDGIEWAIGIEGIVPDEASADLTQAPWILGGHGRTARAESLGSDLFGAPKAIPDAFGTTRGLRLMVVTPTVFTQGWLPDGFAVSADGQGEYRGSITGVAEEMVLRAAFVPRPVHLCGWDVAQNRAKPTLRAVAPGAVYFFQKRSGAPFTGDEARALWFSALGSQTADGLGRVVPGIWNPDEKGSS